MIRDILVHLDSSPGTPARLDLATDIARRLSAHLIGLHVVDVPLPVFVGADMSGGAATAELITALRDDALEDARRSRPAFEEKMRREGISGEWRAPEGNAARQVALHGRYVDLIVVGQLDPGGSNAAASAIVENALFSTGRPVLVVPAIWTAGESFGRRALVAWNASREAARAISDALPLLVGSESVTVLTINAEPTPEGHGEAPGADMAVHLARHGLKVTLRRVAGAEIGAGDQILNEASDLGADLIVMGGYGHSRWRELVLGGATRSILGRMTAPVLLSH